MNAQSPFKLPAPRPEFTGRGAELRQLQLSIRADAASVVSLHGAEGVGKTALALALAQTLVGRYPDGQIWMDLHGHGGPLSSPAAMLQVIHACYPMARVPKDQAGIQAAYRRVLQERRILLVFDGAAADEQLRPLIPPRPCLAVVTSPQPISLPDVYALQLEGLPLEDAKALLVSLASRIGQTAGRLAAICRQLPLALKLAGGMVAARPELEPSDCARRIMVEQFRQVPRGDVDPVEAVLAVSTGLLPDDLRERWHRLAVFPADFNVSAAGTVSAMVPAQAGKVLAELECLGLVQRDSATARYRMHGLVQRAALRRLKSAEQQAARQRHSEHFRAVLAVSEMSSGNATDDPGSGLRVFDLERRNILAGQAWAVEHAHHDDKHIARLVSDYAAYGAQVLAGRLPWEEQWAWLQAAVETARWLGDRAAECGHLAQLGNAFRHLGHPQRAIGYYEQCLPMARDLNDRFSEGNALEKIGLAYADLRQPGRAVEYYERSLHIYQELGDLSAQARTSWNLGLAFRQLDRLPAALAAMQICVDYERLIGHPNTQADAAEVDALCAVHMRRSGPDLDSPDEQGATK